MTSKKKLTAPGQELTNHPDMMVLNSGTPLFLVLEDLQEVDWCAPEFGSLLNHFESFITHCFQGAFVGRTTSFRVGIIRS
jgi:hypothetical protein